MSAPATTRRRLSADERRASILAAGLEVFGRDGYYAASLDEIAALMAVTKPVIYDHFASKTDLYVAVLHEQAGALLAAIAPYTDPGAHPLEVRLSGMAREMCRFARANPAGARLLFRDTVSDPPIAAAYAALRRRSIQISADVTASDPNFTPPPRMSRRRGALALGHLQYTAFATIATLAHDHPRISLDDLVTVFMDFVWIGLGRNTRGEHWPAP